MVMDLADGGALFDLIIEAGNLTEAQASNHILQGKENGLSNRVPALIELN